MTKVLIIIGIILGVGAIGVGIYLLFIAPPHWEYGVETASNGVTEEGNPWIGAKNPKLTIHEYLDYDCPHCSTSHKRIRRSIARKYDKIRLVRHDYARMKCQIGPSTQATSRCQMVRAAICASNHIPFWKWNDYVIENPRYQERLSFEEYVEPILKKFNIPKEQFTACVSKPETIEEAQKFYKQTKKAKVSATPTYIVDDSKLTFSELAGKISSI